MKLHIELSATVTEGSTTETCNTTPEGATAFSVYINNPQAFHIQDFNIDRSSGYRYEMVVLAYKEAYRYAMMLATHLDCPVEVKFKTPNPLEEFIAGIIEEAKSGVFNQNTFALAEGFEERYDITPRA